MNIHLSKRLFQTSHVPSKQRGASMVSLMVGLVVSLITILAMTATHKLVTYTALETSKELSRDSQVMSSIKSLSTEMMQAGYGILPSESGQNLWVSEDGKRVSWRYRQNIGDANYTCSGIEISDNNVRRGLYIFTRSCHSATDLALWLLASRQPLTTKTSFYSKDGEVLGMSLNQAVFVKESSAACAPYGYKPHWDEEEEDEAIVSMIELDTPHPVVSLVVDGQTIFQSCLVNLG